MNNTEQMKNMDEAMLYLSSAENGDEQAQETLCQMFYDDGELAEKMPEDFWKRIEAAGQSGEDYANFIMHCRYYNNPQQGKAAYDYIRRAIRHAKVPLAFMRIGKMFADGTCVRSNHVLASYYYMKAFDGGCEDVADPLRREYEFGTKDIAKDIAMTLDQTGPNAQKKMNMFRRLIDKERELGNYGLLEKLRSIVNKIYPEYNIEEATDDILNYRDTLYADLYYSFCTSDNNNETAVDLQESLLLQLYAPVIQNDQLIKQLYKVSPYDMPSNISELLQCIVNFTHAYKNVCKNNKKKIKEKEFRAMDTLEVFPYIPTCTLSQLRKDAFRCLLSVKHLDKHIDDEFLICLDNDPKLLDINEQITDQDLQLMLISFVELNIDIQAIEITYMRMLHSYMKGDMDYLVCCYNDLANTSRRACCTPPLEDITAETLPPIDLPLT